MRIAVVTGASSGLGKEYIRQIADKMPKLDEIWAILYRYSRALAVELRSRKITVTAVCPYWIKDTEFIPIARQNSDDKMIRRI